MSPSHAIRSACLPAEQLSTRRRAAVHALRRYELLMPCCPATRACVRACVRARAHMRASVSADGVAAGGGVHERNRRADLVLVSSSLIEGTPSGQTRVLTYQHRPVRCARDEARNADARYVQRDLLQDRLWQLLPTLPLRLRPKPPDRPPTRPPTRPPPRKLASVPAMECAVPSRWSRRQRRLAPRQAELASMA